MKKKVIIVVTIILIVLCVTLIVVFHGKENTTPQKLIEKIENAINDCDEEQLVECFPEFMRSDMSKMILQEKMEEFYNNVIEEEGGLDFQIVFTSDYDLTSAKAKEEEINNQYNENIKLADYQQIQVKYHEDFETPMYEIIKIGKNYYLYSGGYYPSPISYFFVD